MRRLLSLPIRYKLMLLAGFVLTGAMLSVIAFSIFNEYHERRYAIEERAGMIGGVLAANVMSAVLFSDASDASKTLHSLINVPDIRAARIMTSVGNTLATYTTSRHEFSPPDWAMPARFEIRVPIMSENAKIGTLFLVVSNASLWQALRTNAQRTTVLMALLMLLALAAASKVGRYITDPIEILAKTARHISSTRNYQLRVTNYADDELGHLIDDFNTMLEEIELRDTQLETNIEQRTVQLRQAKEQAETANRAKSEFLSRMSHELRTPLNSILGFSQVMAGDPALDEDHRDSTNEIFKAGRHLLELVNEVLDLAKIESGRLQLSMETVPLEDVVMECFALIEPLAIKRNLNIERPNMSHMAVRADRIRLKEALLNLISNAVKYNRDHGHIRLSIESRLEHRLRIVVSDSGHGIPEDKLDDIFLPFNRLNAEFSDIEGTGIGLTITRRLIETMGGTVGVHSVVDKGSSFWIELPASTVDEVTQPEQVSKRLQARPGLQCTVLYVEDNPANVKLMVRIFRSLPYIQLITANTPEIGLQLARANPPALVMLDINLPGMDGYELLGRIRAESWGKNLPAIAISANAMQCDIERGNSAGFEAYLTKPVDLNQLNDTLVGLLDPGFMATEEMT